MANIVKYSDRDSLNKAQRLSDLITFGDFVQMQKESQSDLIKGFDAVMQHNLNVENKTSKKAIDESLGSLTSLVAKYEKAKTDQTFEINSLIQEIAKSVDAINVLTDSVNKALNTNYEKINLLGLDSIRELINLRDNPNNRKDVEYQNAVSLRTFSTLNNVKIFDDVNRSVYSVNENISKGRAELAQILAICSELATLDLNDLYGGVPAVMGKENNLPQKVNNVGTAISPYGEVLLPKKREVTTVAKKKQDLSVKDLRDQFLKDKNFKNGKTIINIPYEEVIDEENVENANLSEEEQLEQGIDSSLPKLSLPNLKGMKLPNLRGISMPSINFRPGRIGSAIGSALDSVSSRFASLTRIPGATLASVQHAIQHGFDSVVTNLKKLKEGKLPAFENVALGGLGAMFAASLFSEKGRAFFWDLLKRLGSDILGGLDGLGSKIVASLGEVVSKVGEVVTQIGLSIGAIKEIKVHDPVTGSLFTRKIDFISNFLTSHFPQLFKSGNGKIDQPSELVGDSKFPNPFQIMAPFKYGKSVSNALEASYSDEMSESGKSSGWRVGIKNSANVLYNGKIYKATREDDKNYYLNVNGKEVAFKKDIVPQGFFPRLLNYTPLDNRYVTAVGGSAEANKEQEKLYLLDKATEFLHSFLGKRKDRVKAGDQSVLKELIQASKSQRASFGTSFLTNMFNAVLRKYQSHGGNLNDLISKEVAKNATILDYTVLVKSDGMYAQFVPHDGKYFNSDVEAKRYTNTQYPRGITENMKKQASAIIDVSKDPDFLLKPVSYASVQEKKESGVDFSNNIQSQPGIGIMRRDLLSTSTEPMSSSSSTSSYTSPGGSYDNQQMLMMKSAAGYTGAEIGAQTGFGGGSSQQTIPNLDPSAYTGTRHPYSGVPGYFPKNKFGDFVRMMDRVYYEAGVKRDDIRQTLIAMDVQETGGGQAIIGSYNYGNITTKNPSEGRQAGDKVEKSHPFFKNFKSPMDYAKAKIAMISGHWEVDITKDSPRQLIHKLEGIRGKYAYGTLFSAEEQNYIETGQGYDKISQNGNRKYEVAFAKKLRERGVRDIYTARSAYYWDRIQANAPNVGRYMTGGGTPFTGGDSLLDNMKFDQNIGDTVDANTEATKENTDSQKELKNSLDRLVEKQANDYKASLQNDTRFEDFYKRYVEHQNATGQPVESFESVVLGKNFPLSLEQLEEKHGLRSTVKIDPVADINKHLEVLKNITKPVIKPINAKTDIKDLKPQEVEPGDYGVDAQQVPAYVPDLLEDDPDLGSEDELNKPISSVNNVSNSNATYITNNYGSFKNIGM